jgi:hypothetical protein
MSARNTPAGAAMRSPKRRRHRSNFDFGDKQIIIFHSESGVIGYGQVRKMAERYGYPAG